MITQAELRTMSSEDAAYETLVIEAELGITTDSEAYVSTVLDGMRHALNRRAESGFITRYDDPVEVDGLAGAVMGPNNHDEYNRASFAIWASAFLQTTPEEIRQVREQLEQDDEELQVTKKMFSTLGGDK